MDLMQRDSGYSFSMINLIQLFDGWNLDKFESVLGIAQTRRIELVPSMILGSDWDLRDDASTWSSLQVLKSRFEVTSIQSLTFGLNLQLTDDIGCHPSWQRRFRMLNQLGTMLSCHLYVLGSPGQKKLVADHGDSDAHQSRFADNCRVMAALLAPRGVLCLEHNTLQQGAEYVNTLAAIHAVVAGLEASGCLNVGINLDTKCLLQEFGENLHINELLADKSLASRIRTIQVSLDFLNRGCRHAERDIHHLAEFAAAHQIPISLEEFGLRQDQLQTFVNRWRKASANAR